MTKIIFVVFAYCFCISATAQLNPNFYDYSCPALIPTVRVLLLRAVQREPRMAASLLRLHFHDCFVNGCDGSVLLDDKPGFRGEKTANPNRNSARGFEVIDNIKTAVEQICPGVVSCADILAIVAQQLMNGPTWTIQLGRRDATTASFAGANSAIPPPTATLPQLIARFQAKGLSVQELVALSGSHTIGQSRCTSFRDRLYNFSNTARPDSTLDPRYLRTLQWKCPRSGGDNNLSPLDLQTPTRFDNAYFGNIVDNAGLLNSDQVLYSTPGSLSMDIVSSYDRNPDQFFDDFANAMVKMGNLSPLTGKRGQIRRDCRVVN